MVVKVNVTQSCLTFCDPMDCSPWNSPSQNTGMGSFPSPWNLPNSGINAWSPALQVDSLPAEPEGKPKNTGVGGPSIHHWIFPTQESNWGLLHCRRFLYQLSYWGIKYYNSDIDLNTIYQSYSDYVLLAFICVCVCVYSDLHNFIMFIISYTNTGVKILNKLNQVLCISRGKK